MVTCTGVMGVGVVMMMVVVTEARVIGQESDLGQLKARLAVKKKWQYDPDFVRQFLQRVKQRLKDGDNPDDVTQAQGQASDDVNTSTPDEKPSNDNDDDKRPPETAHNDDDNDDEPSSRKKRSPYYYNYRDDVDDDDDDDSDEDDNSNEDDDDDWGRRGGYAGGGGEGGYGRRLGMSHRCSGYGCRGPGHYRRNSGYGYPSQRGYYHYNRYDNDDDDDDRRYGYGNLVNRAGGDSPFSYGREWNRDDDDDDDSHDNSREVISTGYGYGFGGQYGRGRSPYRSRGGGHHYHHRHRPQYGGAWQESRRPRHGPQW